MEKLQGLQITKTKVKEEKTRPDLCEYCGKGTISTVDLNIRLMKICSLCDKTEVVKK